MNYGISVLFRAIPLLMGLFCFGYGLFITSYGTDPNRFLAGPVVFSLGMICIALFSTAATIIRQIIGTFGTVSKYVLPGVGYLSAALTIIGGIRLLHVSTDTASFVAGHVICGVGLITACVATTATSSTRFTMITVNARKNDHEPPPKAFTRTQGLTLISIALIISVVAWVWAFMLLAKSGLHPKYFVAGHVMIGLASICTCLITLVATIARQIRNIFSASERRIWPVLVLIMGSLCVIWGLILILGTADRGLASTGYIMIGLGLVCYSISSKVILLSKIWRHEFKLSNRIPLIPIFTALGCLFLAAFLFEMGTVHGYYFVPARVLAGLGGICFTLFSIVSILESGTSSK
ncbi:DUF2776 domain-containing protein [uncultured Parabacteroides sp.]|uniref:DUF2776 domain-containing protein n=1 Tax=uncultured Parabacteroides sp. TaxID=512312 RepID=UPI0025F60D8B|nr:DUF2776 domain-containing protein [uncultured Parabacteroides sp.]